MLLITAMVKISPFQPQCDGGRPVNGASPTVLGTASSSVEDFDVSLSELGGLLLPTGSLLDPKYESSRFLPRGPP